ncbi:YkgJ family cysteine cluster protein [Rhizobium sp. BK376]|uniref:YkgJ family cysteine cluster protein n=1 Tax=Rhizobium sp. BK376 TaxID=2512149 RepID=UPI00104C6966|nr:YkgJ family cysteine cluster protein [Rhizobium sp. BK376]TCR92977.1 putative zinc- or iron-chelating protein [Rhizobium sp. BK376]
MSATGTDRIMHDIAAVGELTRLAAERYDGVYVSLRAAMMEALSQAADLGDGARAVMDMADAAAGAIMEHYPNQPVRACRAGCDACCHLHVMIPPGIAEAIAAYLTERLEPEALLTLRGELRKAADAAAGLADPSALVHRCPLLGADGLCTIYDVRPLTCRAFTSRSAAACRSMVFDPESAVTTITQNPAQFRVYVEATGALEQAARLRGLSAQQKGLSAALLELLPD